MDQRFPHGLLNLTKFGQLGYHFRINRFRPQPPDTEGSRYSTDDQNFAEEYVQMATIQSR